MKLANNAKPTQIEATLVRSRAGLALAAMCCCAPTVMAEAKEVFGKDVAVAVAGVHYTV